MSTSTQTSIETGTWAVDKSHSKVGFSVKHMGIANVRGEFTEFEGTLEIAEDGSASARGTVQADTVDTNDEKRDEHLRSNDFFGAEANSTLDFTSTSIEQVSDDEFEIKGELAMNGHTNEVTLKAEFTGADTDPWGNDRVGLEITGQLNRGDWDMTFNQVLGSGNKLVGEKVKLALDVSAVKQA